MRDHLHAAGVEFDDRNVRHDPQARAELEALTGEIVVPVLALAERRVVGYDPEAIDRLVAAQQQGRSAQPSDPADAAPAPCGSQPPGDSLQRHQRGRITEPGRSVRSAVEGLQDRILAEVDYSRQKGTGPYHEGMRDGLRFAADALAELLDNHPDEGRRTP